MTIKRYTNSVKTNRKMHRIPAAKRLSDCRRAGWMMRYKLKRLAKRTKMSFQEECKPHMENVRLGKFDDYHFSHAIWHNSYGSSQPETGVRKVIDGEVQRDFMLIEHGCPDFTLAERIILACLRSGRDPYQTGKIVEWVWGRRRRKQSQATIL